MHYLDDPPSDFISQGDIFRDYAITTIPADFFVCKGEEIERGLQEGNVTLRSSLNLQDLFSTGIEYVVSRAIQTNIIVVSQTCDIQNREFVTISPVFPLSRIVSSKKAQSIKEGKIFYRFFLPAKDNAIEDSYAELTILNSVKREFLSLDRRILALTNFYRGHFVYQLNRLFCRPFMP